MCADSTSAPEASERLPLIKHAHVVATEYRFRRSPNSVDEDKCDYPWSIISRDFP